MSYRKLTVSGIRNRMIDKMEPDIILRGYLCGLPSRAKLISAARDGDMKAVLKVIHFYILYRLVLDNYE
jgi:hypothetical protein